MPVEEASRDLSVDLGRNSADEFSNAAAKQTEELIDSAAIGKAIGVVGRLPVDRLIPNGVKRGPKLLGPGTSIGAKIEKQMAARGWNRTTIERLIRNPHRTKAVRDLRNLPGGGKMDDPAMAYINRQPHYVIRNDRTGDIVQVSNRHDLNWVAPWD